MNSSVIIFSLLFVTVLAFWESLPVLAQGREIPRGERAANFDEFVAMIDQVSNGISVVFRLAADKNPSNPQFARSLKVRGLYDPSTAANPKLFRGTIKRWESAGEDEAAS